MNPYTVITFVGNLTASKLIEICKPEDLEAFKAEIEDLVEKGLIERVRMGYKEVIYQTPSEGKKKPTPIRRVSVKDRILEHIRSFPGTHKAELMVITRSKDSRDTAIRELLGEGKITMKKDGPKILYFAVEPKTPLSKRALKLLDLIENGASHTGGPLKDKGVKFSTNFKLDYSGLESVDLKDLQQLADEGHIVLEGDKWWPASHRKSST